MKALRKIFLWLVATFFISSILGVVAYKWLPVGYTPLMGIRCIGMKWDGKPAKCEHRWVPLDSISPYLPLAVVSSEDANFYDHHGFDWKAIEQARKEHEQGKKLRGASTISQQTAKNVFLWPTSSWVRKGFEAYFTFLIELAWSKERIMEVYLNSIEMGEGIYGAEAVAQEHFNRKAINLTREQCALIAATLPNPRKYSSKNPSAYMRKRQRAILKNMSYMEYKLKQKSKQK